MKPKKQKALLVKTDTRPLEKLINGGWGILHAFPHTGGVLIILKEI